MQRVLCAGRCIKNPVLEIAKCLHGGAGFDEDGTGFDEVLHRERRGSASDTMMSK